MQNVQVLAIADGFETHDPAAPVPSITRQAS
jgi:hypothetical protein